MCSRRLLTLGGSIAVSLLVAGSALATPLPSADQKCIDGYNNFLRLVSAQAGKDYRSCTKNGAKGQTNVQGCITTDLPGKIAGKIAKVTALYPAKCTGSEVIQQGSVVGSAAHVGNLQGLFKDIYGDPILDATIVGVDKATAKCQDKMSQRSGQALTEIIKAQRGCKKNGMKAGTITDEATLDTVCGTFATIDSGGKAAGKLTKLHDDVAAACLGLSAATVAPGKCSTAVDSNALGTCLVARTRCRSCFILNQADGQSIDCDTFDDGLTNGSCFVPINVGTHTCTLAPTSALNLGTQALPLNLVPAGSLNIACGTTDGLGKAPCTCTVNSIGALVIPAIGDVCVSPAACPAGEIDCNGGNSLDVDLVADHNIGACASDTACKTACDGVCNAMVPAGNYSRVSYGCEGFCQGGANNNLACTLDSQCPGGSCTGRDPVTHPGVCNCACQGEGLGGASPAGTLSCEVGTQINVELAPTGICGDAPPSIILPPICGAVSSNIAKGVVLDANNTGGKTIPPIGGMGAAPDVQNGAPIDCNTAAGSSLSGLKMVGHLGFPDSTLGDIFSTNIFVCQ